MTIKKLIERIDSIEKSVESINESKTEKVNEKYMGFDKTVAAIEKSGSAENPKAVAATIGREKYGTERFAGKKLGEEQGVVEADKEDHLDALAQARAEQARRAAAPIKKAKDFISDVDDNYYPMSPRNDYNLNGVKSLTIELNGPIDPRPVRGGDWEKRSPWKEGAEKGYWNIKLYDSDYTSAHYYVFTVTKPEYFKLFLDLANATNPDQPILINRVQGIAEGKGKKPDFLDLDKDGDRKESMKKAAQDRVDESWTDFEDAKKTHTSFGSKVTGRHDDYIVTTADGERRRYITKDGKRKIERLPPVSAKRDDDDEDAPKPKKEVKAKKAKKDVEAKGKKKISEMSNFEFSALMGKLMIIESEMTEPQKEKKEEIAKAMKDTPAKVAALKKRYKGRWEKVVHATATARAMGKPPKKK